MMRRQTWTGILLFFIVALLAVGCGANRLIARAPTPTATPTKTPQPLETATPLVIPSNTPLLSPTPSLIPTDTPPPTTTPLPTDTPFATATFPATETPVATAPVAAVEPAASNSQSSGAAVAVTVPTPLPPPPTPTPPLTETPLPSPTPPPTETPLPPFRFEGQIAQTFTNCALTQIIGVVVDREGNPIKGVNVRLWWDNGDVFRATSGDYVRPETNDAGWDFLLNNYPVANVWYVAIEESAGGPLLSSPVAVQTLGSCNPGDANVVKLQFVKLY